MRSLNDADAFDYVVIGAGVVGAAIARELSRTKGNIALVEAHSDVGMGTSKANTAILHTGFDTVPGTLESQLVTRGYGLLKAYAKTVGIACEITGAILVAWNAEEAAALPGIAAKAGENGVTALKMMTRAEVYAAEPHLGPGVVGGLKILEEGIICPYSPPLAYAYEAKLNGATILLNSPVTAVIKDRDHHLIITPQRTLRGRWVINAAGLASDAVATLFGPKRFTVTARRGELIVFDKLAARLVSHVILPVPTARTKGVLVSPTVYGNVLLGPTAEDVADKTATQTTSAGLAGLLAKGRIILPLLLHEEVTATYAGLRAATEHKDYQIHCDENVRTITVGGIRSTGLTAGLAIGAYVAAKIAAVDGPLVPRVSCAIIAMPPLGEAQTRSYMDPVAIAADPEHGRIVCHCEHVSAAAIAAAFTAPIPAPHLDGLRRRTRCLQGRCQGFFCLAAVTREAARLTGTSQASWWGESR